MTASPLVADNDAHDGRHHRTQNADIGVQEIRQTCNGHNDAQYTTDHSDQRTLAVLDREHLTGSQAGHIGVAGIGGPSGEDQHQHGNDRGNIHGT